MMERQDHSRISRALIKFTSVCLSIIMRPHLLSVVAPRPYLCLSDPERTAKELKMRSYTLE